MKRLILFLFLISISLIVNAKPLDFKSLHVETGLSSNFSRVIYQDCWGYVWIGSLEGLDRFDGRSVSSFNHFLPDNALHISSVLQDDMGNLWVGTKEGLFFWDYVSPKFTIINDHLSGADIGCLALVGDSLFVTTDKGLFCVSTRSKTTDQISLPQQVHVSEQTQLCADSSILYLAVQDAVMCYDIRNNSSVVYNKSYCEDVFDSSWFNFTSILKYKNVLYLGTKHMGVVQFDIKAQLFSKIEGFPNVDVLCLDYYAGQLYAGTDADGLKVYDSTTKQIVTYDKNGLDAISSNSVRDILIDEQELLWLATYDEGMTFTSLRKKVFSRIDLDDKTTSLNLNIRSMFTAQGKRFIGTREGLYVINSDVTHFFSNLNSDLSSNIILNFCEYNDDIFLGTYGGGLYKFSKDFSSLMSVAYDQLALESIYDLEKDSHNNLWITSLSGLFQLRADGSIVKILDDVSIYTLYIDDNNLFWIGTMSGLYVYELCDNKFIERHCFSNLADYKISDIYNVTDGHVWVSTNKGAFEIDHQFNIETHLTEDLGLCSNSVTAIVDITPQEFLISTYKGVSKYSKTDSTIINYLSSDGLSGLTFNPSAALKLDDGSIWLGNTKGIVSFDRGVTRQFTKCKMQLSDILVGGRSILYDDAESLGTPLESTSKIEIYGNSNIGFSFVSFPIEYTSPQQFYVKIARKHRKSEWTKLSNTNTIFYRNLKYGQYIFSVASTTSNGAIDLASIKTINLTLRPKWFQNTLLFFMLLCISVIIVSGLYLSKTKSIKAEPSHKYNSSHLDNDNSKLVLSEIKCYYEDRKIYLNLELKMSDVAKAMNYSVQEISQAINQNEKIGFIDFTNKYRVNEVLLRLSQPDHLKKYTLLTIATECGFNSKSSFYRAFKKVTGKTPASFIKSQNIS